MEGDANMITVEIDRYPSGIIKRKRVLLNGKIHSVGDKPAMKTYYPSGSVQTKSWASHGVLQRSRDRPAMVSFYENKQVNCENWLSLKNGMLHRRFKPAFRIWNYNGTLKFELYALHGQEGRIGAGPTAIRYNMRGKITNTRRAKITRDGAAYGTTQMLDASLLEERCAICLVAYEEDRPFTDYAIVDGCKHTLHQKCFAQWVKTNPTCPICRHQVPVRYRT